jgi:hypothetical protein
MSLTDLTSPTYLTNRWLPRIRHWLVGAWKASLLGGALTVKAFFGIAGISALGLPVQPMNWRQALSAFGFGAAWHFADYLSKNPFPDDVQTSADTNSTNSTKV